MLCQNKILGVSIWTCRTITFRDIDFNFENKQVTFLLKLQFNNFYFYNMICALKAFMTIISNVKIAWFPRNVMLHPISLLVFDIKHVIDYFIIVNFLFFDLKMLIIRASTLINMIRNGHSTCCLNYVESSN